MIKKIFFVFIVIPLVITTVIIAVFFIKHNFSPLIFREQESLFSLNYLSATSRRVSKDDREGVTLYNPELSYPGINIHIYIDHTEAYLMDMSGKVLHTWSLPKTEEGWHDVKICDNGDLLIIVYKKRLIRLDWDSNIKWIKEIKCHHDIAISGNGDIYTITSMEEPFHRLLKERLFIFDYITILTQDGEIKKEIPLGKVLVDNPIFFKAGRKLWINFVIRKLWINFVIGGGVR